MVAMLCGWLQCQQQDAIAFLREENRVLKARLEGKRLRLDDSERRRLAELGHRLGRRLLVPRRSDFDRFTRRPECDWLAADTSGRASRAPGRR